MYSLTSAEQNYSFLSENFTDNANPAVSGTAGLFTGGTFMLTNNTFHGEVDFQGSEMDSLSGAYSVTGGEFANIAAVGTARSDAQTLATTIAGLTETPGGSFTSITASQTLTAGVYDVGTLNLGSGGTLTLSATSSSDQFVIRISNTFDLSSNAQIVFNGPVNTDNVLFYYTGGNAITFSSTSIFLGTLLDNASNAKNVTFDTASSTASVGRVFNISGGDIVMNQGTIDGLGGGESTAPEPATLAIVGGGLFTLGAFRRRKS